MYKYVKNDIILVNNVFLTGSVHMDFVRLNSDLKAKNSAYSHQNVPI